VRTFLDLPTVLFLKFHVPASGRLSGRVNGLTATLTSLRGCTGSRGTNSLEYTN
jgi:hypothetical protein